MRILVMVWSIQIGGAETFAVELCKFLNSKGYNCQLFPVSGFWDYEYYKSIEASDIKIATVLKPGFIDKLSWKLNAVTVKIFHRSFREWITRVYFNYLKKRGFKCIISNSIISDALIYKEGKGKTPFITVEHGDYSKNIIDEKKFSLTALDCADKIVCVSRWCKDILNKSIKSLDVEVIYNGHSRKPVIKLENKISKPLKNKFVFGMIGRADAQKGWEDAIKSFLIVNKHFPEARLLLIGGGEYLESLRRKYNSTNIYFAGYQTEPQNYIQYVDIGLILSHKYEAFGLAILDFFAQGKPVIANSVGGIPEVVKKGNLQGGVLIKNEGDYINAVVTSMKQMITDKHLKDQFSEQSKMIYKEFSFEKTGSEYLKLINDL